MRNLSSQYSFNGTRSPLSCSLAMLCSLALICGVAGAATPASTLSTDASVKKNASKSKSAKLTKTTTEPLGPVLDDATRKQLDVLGQKIDPETKNSINTLAGVVREQDHLIDNEIRDDESEAFSNIGMLWSAAVEHNQTIRYTIEKLSRRDATGKPVANDTVSKRLIQSMVNLGGVAGTVMTGTPASLIGSNMVQGMMSGNPSESALSRVTDADMVNLAREVDILQTRLITLYYNYLHAEERLNLTREANAIVTQSYNRAIAKGDANQASLQPLMQSMQESAHQNERTAQQALLSAQRELSIIVGPEAIEALNKKTENSASTKTSSSSTK